MAKEKSVYCEEDHQGIHEEGFQAQERKEGGQGRIESGTRSRAAT